MGNFSTNQISSSSSSIPVQTTSSTTNGKHPREEENEIELISNESHKIRKIEVETSPASIQTYHWTEVVKRTEISLNLLIKCGLITPVERKYLWESLIPKEMELTLSKDLIQAWCTQALTKIINKVKLLGEICLSKAWNYEACLNKEFFSLQDFDAVTKAVQSTYIACIACNIGRFLVYYTMELDVKHKRYSFITSDPPIEGLFKEQSLIPKTKRKTKFLDTSLYSHGLLSKIDKFLATRPSLLENPELKNQLLATVEAMCILAVAKGTGYDLSLKDLQEEFKVFESLLKRLDPNVKILKPYVFTFEKGEKLEVHFCDALTLATTSSVFNKMLFGTLQEGQSKIVPLQDLTKKEFQTFLNCIQDIEKPTVDTILVLLLKAEQYMITKLFTNCCKWLESVTQKIKVGKRMEWMAALGVIDKGLQLIDIYKNQWETSRDGIISSLLAQVETPKQFSDLIKLLVSNPQLSNPQLVLVSNPPLESDQMLSPNSLKLPYVADFTPKLVPLPSIKTVQFTINVENPQSPVNIDFLTHFPNCESLTLTCMCDLIPKEKWTMLSKLKLQHLEVRFPNGSDDQTEKMCDLIGNLPPLKSLSLNIGYDSPLNLSILCANLNKRLPLLLANLFKPPSKLEVFEIKGLDIYNLGIADLKIYQKEQKAEILFQHFGSYKSTGLSRECILHLSTFFPFLTLVTQGDQSIETYKAELTKETNTWVIKRSLKHQ